MFSLLQSTEICGSLLRVEFIVTPKKIDSICNLKFVEVQRDIESQNKRILVILDQNIHSFINIQGKFCWHYTISEQIKISALYKEVSVISKLNGVEIASVGQQVIDI